MQLHSTEAPHYNMSNAKHTHGDTRISSQNTLPANTSEGEAGRRNTHPGDGEVVRQEDAANCKLVLWTRSLHLLAVSRIAGRVSGVEATFSRTDSDGGCACCE